MNASVTLTNSQVLAGTEVEIEPSQSGNILYPRAFSITKDGGAAYSILSGIPRVLISIGNLGWITLPVTALLSSGKHYDMRTLDYNFNGNLDGTIQGSLGNKNLNVSIDNGTLSGGGVDATVTINVDFDILVDPA